MGCCGENGDPYLSERQWGTVREDYSENGDAWNYFSHDQARSRAYRWGEDGLAGFSDDHQRLCFALALWNGKDPILKERLFGLTNSEGNHGEDVKEYYFYLDATPTHSYMKWLYKYPQQAYPYADLVETNRRRSRNEFEYELLDTGIFDDDRYFDVFVEYAKATPEDMLIRITVANRGPETATLHVLPTFGFATWSSDGGRSQTGYSGRRRSGRCGWLSRPLMGTGMIGFFTAMGQVPLLFTENETNHQSVSVRRIKHAMSKTASMTLSFMASGIRQSGAERNQSGGPLHASRVPAGGQTEIRLRLTV